MKKIYLTLACVAVTAASALAVQPREAELQVFNIKDGKVPSQEVINKHLRMHSATNYEAVGKLVDGKIATGINVYAQEAIESHKAKFGVKSNAPAKKVRKASENKVDLNGNYVNFYLPYFSNQISGKEISYGVVVTMDENNNVTFDGLCGTGVVTATYNSKYTNNKNLTGTYDPATGLITCPGGQVLTTYNGSKQLIISPADLSEGKFSSGGDLVFEVKDDGTIVCQSDLYEHPVGEAGGYRAELSPVLQPATGMISYTSSIAGDIKQPYWYKLTKNDAGEDVLLMSGLDQYQAAGYTTEWKVNADGKTATATDVVGWSNKNTSQDLTFYVCTQNGSNYEQTCTVDFSDKDNIVLPANGNNWSLYDASDYWTGRNTQAKITPVEKVTPGEGPGEEPGEDPSDHGKGTTVAYIDCYKPVFSNWDANKTVTQVVYVTTYEDNYVEIDGIGGVGVEACKGVSGYSNIVNLQGTYDPATKTITIPGGQVLGKYAGTYDITVYVGSTEGGTSIFKAPFELTINAEGQLVCTGSITTNLGVIPADMIYIGAMSGGSLAGGLAGQYTPVFNPANGKINYDYMVSSTNTGTIDEPFYYAVVTKGSKKVLRTSNLANRAGEGYMVEFVIDEADKTATTTDAATYNDSESGDFILKSSLAGSSSDLTTTVVANITDLKKIILPKEGYWTCITASNSYFGWNEPATITGTPVELQEEGGNEPGSAVQEIVSSDTDAVVYYDINGRKVNGELGSGVYIRVQGSKASKVLVK